MRRQIDSQKTKQVRIGSQLHQIIKVTAAKKGVSIRSFIESLIRQVLQL